MQILAEYKKAEKISKIDTIFFDYEGILTKEDMHLAKIYMNEKAYRAEKFKVCQELKEEFFKCGVLGSGYKEGKLSDKSFEKNQLAKTPGFINQQVHNAFLKAAKEEKIQADKIVQKVKIKDVLEEGHQRRIVSVMALEEKQCIMYTQGTGKEILPKITCILTENGVKKADSSQIKNIKKAAIKFGEKGLRVVVLAKKKLRTEQESITEKEEENLTFVGLAAFRDNIKEDSAELLRSCRELGVRSVIVTEESKTAALAIAERLEILKGKKSVMDGKRLNELEEQERKKAVLDSVIFSRISQKQRVEIIKILKEAGKNVLSVGNGSELLVSDVKTEEKDLKNLIKMLAKGYDTYVKINGALSYIITGILSIVFTMVCVGLFQKKLLYFPLEFLALTVVLTILGGVLVLSEKSSDFRQGKSNKKSQNIRKKLYITEIFKNAFIIGISTLISYAGNLENGWEVASLAGFVTILTALVFHAFSSKSEYTTLFTKKLFDNKYLNSAGVMCILILHVYLFVNIPDNKMVREALTSTSAVIIYLCSIMSFAMVQILKNPVRRGEISE